MVLLVGMVLVGLSVLVILAESVWLTVHSTEKLRFIYLLIILTATILVENLRYLGLNPMVTFVGYFITVLTISAGYEAIVTSYHPKR
jgi:hypothetical protein